MNIREIAKRCDVSVGTVSHILNGRAGVKKEARQRVMRLVKKAKYDPADNVAAVKKVKQNAIKAVLPYGVHQVMTVPFYNKAMEGLKMQASVDGIEILVAHEQDFRRTVTENNGNYKLRNAAGVLFICPKEDWRDEMKRFIAAGVPVAVVNRPVDVEGVITVMEKRDEGIRQLLTHLKEHGCTRAACFNTSGPQVPTVPLLEKHAREAGIEIINAGTANNAWNVLLEDLAAMHGRGEIPGTIIAFGDLMALRIIKYLQRWGYRVPQDVRVTGYDNVDASTYVYPELTTVNSPIDSMTAFAAGQLLARIGDPDVAATQTYFESELIIRESCGCLQLS